MDINLIKNILCKYFDKVENIDEKSTILKCQKYYNENLYQIYYVDYSEEWKSDTFDIEEYLEKYISDNYYTNPGFLQWNFYLIMLYEPEIIDSNLKNKITEIQKNESYCRKYIVNEKQLENWLDKKCNVEIEKDENISEDLAELWITKLEKNDLDCIFMKDVKYTDGVKSIIEGNTIKQDDNSMKNIINANRGGESEVVEDIEMRKIPRIKKLTLENYRKFPIKRDFEFGKVNLFTGQNGTGKTSVLEAIELLLCGKNYRNQNAESDEIKINAYFEGFDKVVSNKCDNKTFKKRYEFWYNKPQSNGINRLCVGFNRYNFFNTDASFELTSEKKADGDINKAFEDIALGENVNYIENRLFGYQERLKKEESNTIKFIDDYEKVINDEEKTLIELNDGMCNPDLLFDKFITNAKNIYWKGSILNNLKKQYSDFENDFIKVENSLNILIKDINWINELTKKDIDNEEADIDYIVMCYKSYQEEIYMLNQEFRGIEREIKNINEVVDLLNEYRFYEEKNIKIKLEGINARISELYNRKMLLNECLEELQKCDLTILSNSGESISNFHINLGEKLKLQKEKYRECEEKTSAIKKSLSQLEAIVVEIKAKGKEVLRINTDINKCPLCNTPYSNNELQKRIEAIYTVFENAEVLEKYVKEGEFLKINIDNLERQYITVKKVKEILYRLNCIKKEDMSLGDALNYIESIKSQAEEINDEYFKWYRIRDELAADGLTEEEYNKLRRHLNSLKVEEIYGVDNIKNYENKLSELMEKKNSINNEIYIKEKKIRNIVQEYLKSSYKDNFEDIIIDRQKKIKKAIVLIGSINEYIELAEKDNIWIKKKEFEELHELFNKFKLEKEQKDKIDIIKRKSINTIEDYRIKLNEKRAILRKIDKALSIINDILENHSKNNYLKEFMNSNREKIVRIFTEIHSPAEFIDIYFEEGSSIILKRTDTNEITDLKSISTGQRSALALAVFLCLNQKLKNGPPYLIFDDPIAFIDDLNILSFIDYIREMIVSTDRQIFFATANENLAFLLKQKFSFLGENDFKVYKFDKEVKSN
ncbi:SMC domain protein [Clostridium sp. DL-VIII]|uniref:SMC domain protein n=1 Tax=Clostridium sp. DL-VIII TaxID=641107 RepID=UPI00023AFEF6|nr:SMC domain protein [Clostridium sp. DL-VIII]EHI99065.1 SMC domain protein [Clostridium sp. DL-VIII]